MVTHRTAPKHAALHPSGWHTLPGTGVEITRLQVRFGRAGVEVALRVWISRCRWSLYVQIARTPKTFAVSTASL